MSEFEVGDKVKLIRLPKNGKEALYDVVDWEDGIKWMEIGLVGEVYLDSDNPSVQFTLKNRQVKRWHTLGSLLQKVDSESTEIGECVCPTLVMINGHADGCAHQGAWKKKMKAKGIWI